MPSITEAEIGLDSFPGTTAHWNNAATREVLTMKIMKRVLLSLLIGLPVSILSAQTAAISPDSGATHRYIVRLKDSVHARADIELLPSFRKYQRMENLPIVTVDATQAEAEQLRAHPDVEYIVPDRPLRASSDLIAQTINATNSGSGPAVWTYGAGGFSGNTGSGIAVAVIDSGIDYTARDFGNVAGKLDGNNNRIVYRENFLVPPQPNGQYNGDRYKTSDGYGHGTHVAGLIAGNGFVSNQLGSIESLAGIAPSANLIDLQVLD